MDRARAIVTDVTQEDRFATAYEICKKAVGSPDTRRALGDLIKYTINLFTTKRQSAYVKEALEIYEKNITLYPDNAFAIMDVALCYNYLNKYPQMLEHAEKALAFPGLTVLQRRSALSSYLKMLKDYYDSCGDKALLSKML